MKQITSFNIARLRVEEDFGFLKLVVAETNNLVSDSDSPDEISVLATSAPDTLTTSIATFKSAVDTFDNALKDSAAVPSSAIAAEADTARDNAWRGANNYLKAMTAHPTETVRKTAAEIKTLFDKYGDRPSADGGKRHPAQPLAGPERHRQRQTGKHFLRGMAHEFGRLRRGVPRRRVATYGRGSRPTGGHREGKPPSGGHRLPLADRLGERPRRGERGRSVRHVHRPRERAHRTSENGAEGTGDE